MKVLMTVDAVGGVWTYALELTRALAPFGVDVTLGTMGPTPNAAQVAEVDSIANAELVTSTFALEWMPDPWSDVDAAGEWLLDLAIGHDLVHLNGYAHAALPFEVPVISVAHSCVLTWWRAVHGTAAPAEWKEYRRRVRAGLLAADRVVGPTLAILDDILATYEATTRSRVIYNGCDAVRWRPAPKQPFILAAGRLWDEAKGLGDLAACADRLRWPVHVAGSGGGAARGIQFLGQLPPAELGSWMSRAAIYALPARYEPFGLSIVEAALSGCALVIGDLPTLREIWRECAIYVRPGEIASALDVLTADLDCCVRLGAAARERALALSAARMAAAYFELYQEVCA